MGICFISYWIYVFLFCKNIKLIWNTFYSLLFIDINPDKMMCNLSMLRYSGVPLTWISRSQMIISWVLVAIVSKFLSFMKWIKYWFLMYKGLCFIALLINVWFDSVHPSAFNGTRNINSDNQTVVSCSWNFELLISVMNNYSLVANIFFFLINSVWIIYSKYC